MAIDGKLLIKAKRRLEELRVINADAYQRRIDEVYARSPRIRDIDRQIQSNMPKILGIAIGAETGVTPEDIIAGNDLLHKQRREELEKAGFRSDYLDEVYMCPHCKDTGYVKSNMCRCLKNLYKEELSKSLSSLLKLGNETFESFDLGYYDDTPAQGSSISPKQNMELIYQTCRQYANKFSEKSMNLFFNGAPGLGKTFLSACIARVVADKEFSVVYETAIAIFNTYEDMQFSKSDTPEETRAEIKRYLECDLLIIDDLGTEMSNTPTFEALYDIVNTRLIKNRKTIINSNLTVEEMRLRYPEQIMSRLEGEYQVLTFYGEDIRKKKNKVL